MNHQELKSIIRATPVSRAVFRLKKVPSWATDDSVEAARKGVAVPGRLGIGTNRESLKGLKVGDEIISLSGDIQGGWFRRIKDKSDWTLGCTHLEFIEYRIL